MNKTALEAIGSIFTDEVLDIILKEGLVDYYEVVKSFRREEYQHPDDAVISKRVMAALAIVIEDFMTEDEYLEWMKENMV